MRRKLAIALAMVFSLASTVPAWATGYQDLFFQKEIASENGQLTVYGGGELHGFGCRCMPMGSIKMQIPEGMFGKRLYFQVVQQGAKGMRAITPADHWGIYEKGENVPLSAEGIFSVACDAAEKSIAFAPTAVDVDRSGTAYALRLLGGTAYGDNTFYGKEDRVLTNTLFYLYISPPGYRKDYDIKRYTLEVSAGSEIALINGEENAWNGKAYKNEDGVWMVPLRSALASLPQDSFKGILWEEATNTAIVIWVSRTLRFTEGEAVYTRNGKEIAGTAKVERKDGVTYIPFETMREFWDEGEISYDRESRKITGTILVPKEESGAEGQ